jgi:hypothetical protein
MRKASRLSPQASGEHSEPRVAAGVGPRGSEKS